MKKGFIMCVLMCFMSGWMGVGRALIPIIPSNEEFNDLIHRPGILVATCFYDSESNKQNAVWAKKFKNFSKAYPRVQERCHGVFFSKVDLAAVSQDDRTVMVQAENLTTMPSLVRVILYKQGQEAGRRDFTVDESGDVGQVLYSFIMDVLKADMDRMQTSEPEPQAEPMAQAEPIDQAGPTAEVVEVPEGDVLPGYYEEDPYHGIYSPSQYTYPPDFYYPYGFYGSSVRGRIHRFHGHQARDRGPLRETRWHSGSSAARSSSSSRSFSGGSHAGGGHSGSSSGSHSGGHSGGRR